MLTYKKALKLLVFDSFDVFVTDYEWLHSDKHAEERAAWDDEHREFRQRELLKESADLEARIDMMRGIYNRSESKVMQDLWTLKGE